MKIGVRFKTSQTGSRLWPQMFFVFCKPFSYEADIPQTFAETFVDLNSPPCTSPLQPRGIGGSNQGLDQALTKA